MFSTLYCDAAEAWQRNLQDSASTNFDSVTDLHDFICYWLIVMLALVVVFGFMIFLQKKKIAIRNLNLVTKVILALFLILALITIAFSLYLLLTALVSWAMWRIGFFSSEITCTENEPWPTGSRPAAPRQLDPKRYPDYILGTMRGNPTPGGLPNPFSNTGLPQNRSELPGIDQLGRPNLTNIVQNPYRFLTMGWLLENYRRKKLMTPVFRVDSDWDSMLFGISAGLSARAIMMSTPNMTFMRGTLLRAGYSTLSLAFSLIRNYLNEGANTKWAKGFETPIPRDPKTGLPVHPHRIGELDLDLPGISQGPLSESNGDIVRSLNESRGEMIKSSLGGDFFEWVLGYFKSFFKGSDTAINPYAYVDFPLDLLNSLLSNQNTLIMVFLTLSVALIFFYFSLLILIYSREFREPFLKFLDKKGQSKNKIISYVAPKIAFLANLSFKANERQIITTYAIMGFVILAMLLTGIHAFYHPLPFIFSVK